MILAKLRETLLAGGNMDRLKRCLRDRLEQRCRPDTKQADRLQRQLRELDKQLDRFAKNWFAAPESLLPTLTAEAEAKKRERELVTEQLRQAEIAAQPIDIEAQVTGGGRKSLDAGRRIERRPAGSAAGADAAAGGPRRRVIHRTSPRKTTRIPPGGRSHPLPRRVVRFCRSGRLDLNQRPLRPESWFRSPPATLFFPAFRPFSRQKPRSSSVAFDRILSQVYRYDASCHSVKRYIPVWHLGGLGRVGSLSGLASKVLRLSSAQWLQVVRNGARDGAGKFEVMRIPRADACYLSLPEIILGVVVSSLPPERLPRSYLSAKGPHDEILAPRVLSRRRNCGWSPSPF